MGGYSRNTVLHITKNDFQLTVKVYYEIIFFLDQLKTKLNFQFLYDQLGLCFFLLCKLSSKIRNRFVLRMASLVAITRVPHLRNNKFGVTIPNQLENVLLHL